MGQQHLRSLQTMHSETGLPGLHQPHLPDRRSSLQLVHVARPGNPAQTTHACRHRAGRNQHQLDASAVQGDHLLDPHRHGIAIQTAAIRGEQRTADLHHPAPRAGYLLTHTLNLRSQASTRLSGPGRRSDQGT
ncbi:hypothetical protein D3C78_1236990 [compost metagenome]